MKRLLTSATLFLCSLLTFAQFTGTQTDSQGVMYTANDDGTTCFVSGHSDEYKSEIIIPNVYEGLSVTSIGKSAFHSCSSLTSLTIPSSVTSIGISAFMYCSSITSVMIPSSVTCIGEYAFHSCSSLMSLTIPFGVTSIGNGAFKDCSSLTSVTIPSSVTSIGQGAFCYCRNLTSLAIPSSVTSIADHAFSECSSLTTLTIPSSVTSIGKGAFSGSRNLTSLIVKWPQPIIISTDVFYTSNAILIVPKGSKALYKEAEGWKRFKTIKEPFEGTVTDSQGVKFTANNDDWTCRVSGHETTYDANVTIPEIYEGRTVTSIGSEAFSGCSELTSVTISSSLTTIGDNAFAGCNSLEWLDVDWTTPLEIIADAFNNSSYQDATLYVPVDCKATYEKAKVWKDFKEIVALFNGNVTDFQGVKYTANNDKATCFVSSYNNSNGIVSIPETYGGRKVTSIGEKAFFGCNRLTSVIIPEGVTSIGGLAFERCSNLTSIDIPSSMTSISYRCFQGCSSLASVTIPSSVTSIGNSAFSGCSDLTSLTIPSSVTSIDSYAFNGCSSLTSLTIPSSVTSIGWKTFSGCSSITSLTIPSSITSIGWESFSGCRRLTSLTIPFSVTSIDNSAFKGCSGLETITVEEENTVYDSRNNCNAIIRTADNSLLFGCQNTVIPANVTSIDGAAFYGCSNLTSITIPASVTAVSGSAFEGCSGLKTITVEEGNTVYDSRNNCNAIIRTSDNSLIVGCQNTIIPSDMTSIGDGAFKGCSSLTSLTIPENVISIGGAALSGCTGLSSVTVDWDTPIEVASDAFGGGTIDKTLYVPRGTKELYENAEVWKDFREIVEYERPFTFGTPDVAVSLRQKIKLPIELTNLEETVAYQFDLTLPEGFTLAMDSKGQYLVKKTGRYEDENQILNVTLLEDGSYRFVCFSMEKGKITGTSGPVLNVFVVMDHDMALGDYQGSISNIVLTKADQQQKRMKIDDFVITVNDLAEGDSNGDGELNVSDIVEIVNYIMQKPSEQFVPRTADLNGDGDVNVTDVVVLVDVIMAPEASRSSERGLNASTDNDLLTIADAGGQSFGLWLTNEALYVASQFDIRLSAGQTLEGVTLNNSRASGHLLTCEEIGAGLYRVVVFSLTGSAYRGDNGKLLNINVKGQGEVSVENILFVTADATEKRFADLSSGTTSIGTARLLASPADIYTTDGRLARRQATSLSGLQKGVYIVNGKKEIVK